MGIAAIFAMSPGASAFETSAYTETSLLASDRWMKISVESDGLYMIPTSTLRSWGFSDINNVRIFGYGGHRQPDILTIDTYRDDLPQIQ